MRFLKEFNNKVYIVSVTTIVVFEPKHYNDFDEKGAYSLFWEDPDEDHTGMYTVQVPMMAGKYDRGIKCIAELFANPF